MSYAVITTAALALVTYLELNPSKNKLTNWELVSLAAVAAFFGAGPIAFRAVGEYLGDVSHKTRLRLEEPAKACIAALAAVTDIPITRIGVTVFVVLRSRGHMWSGIQKRVVRMRLESNPAPTHIRWTKRKGLLGRCWTELEDVCVNHQLQFGEYMACTKKEWRKSVPDSVKQYLTYKDYKQIRHYGFIHASPMIDLSDGHYKGCVVVQVSDRFEEQMKTEEVVEIIRTCAGTACTMLK
jgi:hypothetical protein